MAINKVKMYPDVDSEGAFEVNSQLSEAIADVYDLVDSVLDPSDTENILEDYYAGVLKTVETILATPIGQLQEKLEELLEEVYVSAQVNYDALRKTNTDKESVDKSRDKQDPIIVERKIDLDDDDISDEEMLRILPD